MIVEERIYTLHHGKVAEYLNLYEEEGRAIQLKILGCNVGYYTVDTLSLIHISEPTRPY